MKSFNKTETPVFLSVVCSSFTKAIVLPFLCCKSSLFMRRSFICCVCFDTENLFCTFHEPKDQVTRNLVGSTGRLIDQLRVKDGRHLENLFCASPPEPKG